MPHPNPTPNKSNAAGADGDGNGGGGAAPFHTRSTTRASSNQQRPTTSTFYKPSVHQFTCRGAFHLQQNDPKVNNPVNPSNDGKENNDGADLEALIKDTFLCNGIQSKLRHVADYPPAKDKEMAIRWFEGSSPMGISMNNNGKEVYAAEAGGGDDAAADVNDGGDAADDGIESVDIQPESTFSSYGTTQVNILTLQKIPVSSLPPRHHQPEDDPFNGFGPLSASGNPFGSLFCSFFGSGGMIDPFSQHPHSGEEANNNNNNSRGWLKSSKTVSSSTKIDRDENGKRVVKTVTKATTVDGEGKRRVETVTTERHVDDGGRVETYTVVQTDGDDDAKEVKNSVKESGNAAGNKIVIDSSAANTSPILPPGMAAPTAQMAQQTAGTEQPIPYPTEVAVIATDCLLGVSVSDSVTHDPDSAVPQSTTTSSSTSKNNNTDKDGNGVGWRKSEYLFRLGRFIPPFMIVNKYYQDKEEDERRRKDMQKEYNDMRDRMKKNRWDKSSQKDDDKEATTTSTTGIGNGTKGSNTNNNSNTTSTSTNTPISDNLSAASSRTEYYLQRIYVQMDKNLNMMGVLLNEMTKPEFPKKVQLSGEKIVDNMGPTLERTGKLMGDVWDMWMGWSGNAGNGGGGGNRGGK